MPSGRRPIARASAPACRPLTAPPVLPPRQPPPAGPHLASGTTLTDPPGRTPLTPSGTIASPSAEPSELTSPDPWGPESRATGGSPASLTRRKVVTCGGEASFSPATAATRSSAAGPKPPSASRWGRTRVSKVTKAEDGLPGSEKTASPPREPKATGLPGRMRSLQKSSSKPRSASTPFTRSRSPIEAPPEMTSTSAARASSSSRISSSSSSPTRECGPATAPAARA